jgi:hypothetical protein
MLPANSRRLWSAARTKFLASLAAAVWVCSGCAGGNNSPPPPPPNPLTINATVSPQPNANGWNNTNVTVSFTCSDTSSGTPTCPPPQSLTTEGANQIVSGTATDTAGNTATTRLMISIDKTPPTISAAPSPGANASGWNNTNVAVTFTCADAGSGVASCPPTQTVTVEGPNQAIAGTVTDKAGNTASASVTLNIDKTPPAITASASPTPNTAGWNNSNVTVTFNCSDQTSGVAFCAPPTTLTTEGSKQSISGSAVDIAGNTATASVTVNLDKTPPSVTIDSTKNGSLVSLSTSSFTLGGSESDSLSGVAGVTCNNVPATISGSTYSCTVSLVQGSNSISVQATDVAGNSSTSPIGLTYAPAPQIAITSPANLTVTNLSPVTVSGTISDPAATVTINGITAPQNSGKFSIPVPLVEGLNVLSAVGKNSSNVVSTATVQVTLDTTPPHVTIDSPADGFTTTDASVTVSGLANDVVVGTVNALDVQVTVNGTAAQVANRTYSVPNVQLAVGKNTIQAKGVDRAGNGTTTSITVTRVLPSQPPPPAIGQALITNSFSVVSGNNQSATIGAQLPAPLVVALKDMANKPVPNQTVVFKVTGNNGTVSASSSGAPSTAVPVTTDANGLAQAYWTLGERSGAGINTVQASSTLAIGAANFTATGLIGNSAQIVVDSGNQQTGAIGQPLPFPFVVVAVDSGHNRVPNVPVTFTVKGGGGNIGGAATQSVTTDSDGRAIAVLTLGLQEGYENNLVEVTFPANPGSLVAFSATAKAPGDPASTTISGVVLDNSNNPIPGVTMRLYQTNQGSANNLPVQIGTPVQTNAQGTFLIPSAPVGSFKLMADGGTVTGTKSYPPLEYDITTVAGNDNTVGMPIYLPALDTVNKVCVDAAHGGTLTLPQVPGFSLTIQPGAATFPGGSRTGCVTVTPVNGDKVPMAPGFGQQPRFIVTIQPVGTTFNPPAALTIPNVDGLPPRAVTEMYSYDHDLGMFVAIGAATVSDDGSVIVSNPGVGVLKAGWHCGGNPNSSGSAGTCAACETCQGTQCGPDVSLDGTACSTSIVPSGICNNGICKPNKGRLQIDQPSANTRFNITSSPQMPQISAHAHILDISPDPTPSTDFIWTTQIRYTGPNGHSTSLDIPATTITGGGYTANTGGVIRGGDLTFMASATVNGNVLTDQTTGVNIRGINPSHQQVNGQLGGFPATSIACWESNHQLAQFDSQGLPLFGPPNGYGIMQVDNPPVSDEGIWNWQQNVAEGLAILASKRAVAIAYPSHVQQMFPDATDFVALNLIDQATNQPYVVLETIQRYNGGHYWVWNDTSKTWVKSPPNNYVAKVLASSCP